VPASCTKLGPKRAFDELGTWAAVKAAIAADANVQEEWDLATQIRRADPLVQHMIAIVGLTDAQVNQLLIRANALVRSGLRGKWAANGRILAAGARFE
jgi:hypothetical protein